MTICDWKALPRKEQLTYQWVCYDWKEHEAIGFFKEVKEADAMTNHWNKTQTMDWNGLPRYQTILEEGEFNY